MLAVRCLFKSLFLPCLHPTQYALTAMQNLMELDYGWSTLDDAFIFQVVQILSSSPYLVNVCRPATAILKKLVEADPMSAPGLQQLAGSSRGPPTLPAGSVYRYGFHVVFEQMRKGRGFLETVISRLGSADTAMAQYRCASNTCHYCINAK
jgi:engulfment/cell motility protein 1